MVDYYGAQACCGTYAFMNTARAFNIDVEIFEAMTSVPFGLKHIEGDLKRILTPLANRNDYLEDVAALMGFKTETHFCDTTHDVCDVIRNNAEGGYRFMIGPVDMGHLTHLPQSIYYKGQDHYFTVEVQENHGLLVIDSEGTLFYPYTYDELGRVMSVRGIPESRGFFIVRRFLRADLSGTSDEIRCFILKRAASNMALARESNQGAQSFYRCWEVITKSAPIKWRLPLIHEMSFLIQRKFIQRRLLTFWSTNALRPQIDRQIEVLGSLRQKLLMQEALDHNYFVTLANIEEKITDAVIKLEVQRL